MSNRTSTIWLCSLLLVPLLAMGFRMWGLNASETWDEVAYFDASHDYYQNVVSGKWNDANAWIANREHPAVAKWLYLLPSLDAIKHGVSDYNPGRLLAAFLGSLTVLLTMLLGRRLFSWQVGTLAGLTIALLPTVIGLNRVLGLDTPFTFFFVLTIWAFVEATVSKDHTATDLFTERHGKDSRSRLVAHDHRAKNDGGWWNNLQLTTYNLPLWLWHLIALLAFGLTMGTRLTGVLLWPILAMIAIIAGVTSHESRDETGFVSRISYLVSRLLRSVTKPSTIFIALLYVLIPIGIVYGSWPWLWHDTAAHWDITWGHWSPVANFFLGVIQEPGPGYYAIYFLATFPALFVILSIFWVARAIARPTRSDLILLVWVLGVFAFSAYGLRQGGFRYLIQLAPALAIGVSAYLVELNSRITKLLLTNKNRHAELVSASGDSLRQIPKQVRDDENQWASWLIPALFVAYLIPQAISHQPYQLDYYNEFTGGTANVADGKWLQVGWWGEGVDEAVDWLNEHAEYDADISFTALPDRAQRRLRKDFDHTALKPEYILTNPAYTWFHPGYPSTLEYTRVYVVKAGGAAIAEVWQRIED